MEDIFDNLSTLSLDDTHLQHPVGRKKKSRINGKFLRGPISWDWLLQAGKLPGKALQVALFIQHYRGILKNDTVPLNLSKISREMAIDRSTASRALDHLEKAGLVQVQRLPGRKVLVTVAGKDEHSSATPI